jgi:hypothetical protein
MYALIINDVVEKYSYSIGQLRKDNPQTSFPKNPTAELLADWNVFDVVSIDRPEIDYTKNVREGVPEKINGVWTQVWQVTDATESEINERLSQQTEQARESRKDAYRGEADPLFFKAQRGEATMDEWLAKVEEIKARFPKG